jgi:hypothetical protein
MTQASHDSVVSVCRTLRREKTVESEPQNEIDAYVELHMKLEMTNK